MQKYFYTCIAVLLCSLAGNAQIRKDSILLNETFETTSPTVGDWRVYSPTCSSSDIWSLYTGTGANSSAKYVGFPSSFASSGCSQELRSPEVTADKQTLDDSIQISFWIYRTSTSSSDYVDINISDLSDNVLAGPVRVYQYNLQTPATNTGWVRLYWNTSYNTLAPTASSVDFLVRIEAVSGNGADLMLDDIQIHHIWKLNTKPVLEVITPDENTLMTAGRTFLSLKWGYKGTSDITDPVKIEYSLDGGDNWSDIVTTDGTSNTYAWDIPVTKTDAALIRVTDVNDATITATSDLFSIIWPIDLTSTNDGGSYGVGTKVPIRWLRAKNVYGLNIEFSSDGGTNWSPVAENVSASDGYYEWTVPAIPTTDGIIRLVDLDGANLTDQSDMPFSIIYPLKVNSPNGGETVGSGYKVPITWQNIGSVQKIKISFTVNGGVQWNDIATDIDANAGTYLWTIPAVTSATAKVRISDMTNVDVYDESNEYFSIYDASSIGETPEASAFNCYPNPSNGKFTVRSQQRLAEHTLVQVTDLTGRLVYSTAMQSGLDVLDIDVRGLKPGIYTVLFSGSDATTRKQIIIE